MKKKVLSTVLAFAMVLMQIGVVSAKELAGDYEGHWASNTIQTWMGQGLVNGFEDGSFRPNENVTRAQFVTMLHNVFGFQVQGETVYKDIKTSDWYYNTILKASAAGVVGGSDGMFRPNDLMTRQEAAVALYNAYIMVAPEDDATKAFDDAGLIAPWAKAQVNTLVANDYMRGRTKTTIVPGGYLTRAEAVTLLANISGTVINQAGRVTGEFDGNVVINTSDVVLEDVIIEGNLYIGPGAAEGDANLNNVTVKGKLIVLGGGVNSVILKNTSVNGLLVRKIGGKVRIVVIGSTKVENTVLESGAILEEDQVTDQGFGTVDIRIVQPGELVTLDGDFDEVNIETAGVSIDVIEGRIGLLNIEEKAVGSKVEISSLASIKKADVKAETTFAGKGIIEEAQVESDGVSFEKEPEKLEVAEGFEVEIEKPKSTGGGGGGGGSASGDTPAREVELLITLPTYGPVTISAKSDAGLDVIYKKLFEALDSNKDGLLDNYSAIIDELDVDVETLDGQGTIFADALSKDVNRVIIEAALDAMKDKTMNQVKAELEKLTENRANFEAVKYDGKHLTELTISTLNSGKTTEIESPTGSVSKAFNIFKDINMKTNETYTITMTFDDETFKTVTIQVSSNN